MPGSGVTYACPIQVALRLIVWEKEEGEEEVKQIRDIKEQDIYLGEIPLMTRLDPSSSTEQSV